VSSGTISFRFDSCADPSWKDAICCGSSRNVSTKWVLTGLFQFPVPAVEGGSNLAQKSPYAALRKPLHAAQFKALSVRGRLLSSCICAFCAVLIYVHLFGLAVLAQNSRLDF